LIVLHKLLELVCAAQSSAARLQDAMNAQTSMTTTAIPFAVPTGRWDDAVTATLSPPTSLLYRTNALGSDLTVTNFCCGSTSAKLGEIDPLTGESVEVLWVKGLGAGTV